MDSQTRIATYQQSLRVLYAGNLTGLKAKIAALQSEAEDGVIITSNSFEGEQSTGQVVLEPLEKLNAALAVLAELDPDNTPTAPDTIVYADLGGDYLRT